MWDQGGLRALAAIGAGNDLKTDEQINIRTNKQTSGQKFHVQEGQNLLLAK